MNKVDIQFTNGTVLQVLDSLLIKLDDLSEPMNDIAAVLESATESAFEAEADPVTGQAWASLSDAYLKANPKRQGGKILQASAGGLAASVAADSGNFWAAIGSNKIYAAIHQFGGTDDMPAGPAGIPARPYLGVSREDEQSMLGILGEYFEG
ncbi:phage virion morphogenesis protein [Shewanella sp. NKUCC05_KAH]|uniref:phage virion morphogenesis protein n=1 Tax=Shewanella sp. NKUCC05_KAH TaxID=2842126 RepID=UPI001C5BDD92|nr:phage virion morphogenesis protein [Shewanella sp. NKUCC05_KAH]MBW3527684.1 phage virion morphogenesis protein [Shewanella sp. NKUCC05_KAH]